MFSQVPRQSGGGGSGAGTGSVANREDAYAAIAVARSALSAKDIPKAEKFAHKARRLYPCDEVDRLLMAINITKTGEAARTRGQAAEQQGTSSSSYANGTHPSSAHWQSQTSPAPDSSRSTRTTDGPQGVPPLRQRRQDQPPQPDPGTPEQKALVSQILKAKDLYAILNVPRTATDVEIKKAYRKLALQLHPDKNSAHGADDAFKAVGRSFACLSDPDKRAYYDRTGFESTSEAQAAAAQRSASMRARGPAGTTMYYDEIDPNEIFNIFFGGMGMGMGPGARMYTTRPSRPRPTASTAGPRGAGPSPAAADAAADSSRVFLNFIQIMPVLLLIVFSWLSSSSRPGFSLTQDRSNFPEPMTTARLEVPFFVTSAKAFEASYPRGSASRAQMEVKIEQAFLERLQYKCNQEKMARHRGFAFGGNKGRAARDPLVSCDEADNMIRKLRYPNYVY